MAKRGGRPGQSNLVRIIGGEHGGRKLAFPDGRGLRPTSDRIRETLFNWLQAELPGASCLDLFAGSGALGLEAASRGASNITLLDTNPAVYSQLKQNIALLGVEQQVTLIREDALRWLNTDPTPYQIVFLDPPFADGLMGRCASQLEQGWLAIGARIYAEWGLDGEQPEFPGSWRLLKQKRAGQVAYSLFSRGE